MVESFWAARKMYRSLFSASSTALMDRPLPTNSGRIIYGYMTTSLMGRSGMFSGISIACFSFSMPVSPTLSLFA